MSRPDVVRMLPHARELGGTERTVRDLLASDERADLDHAGALVQPTPRPAATIVSCRGFSRALLEALSAGLPAMVIAVGGTSEVAGAALVRVPAGNGEALEAAVCSWLADSRSLAGAQVAARATAARFDVATCHSGYRQLYADLGLP